MFFFLLFDATVKYRTILCSPPFEGAMNTSPATTPSCCQDILPEAVPTTDAWIIYHVYETTARRFVVVAVAVVVVAVFFSGGGLAARRRANIALLKHLLTCFSSVMGVCGSTELILLTTRYFKHGRLLRYSAQHTYNALTRAAVVFCFLAETLPGWRGSLTQNSLEFHFFFSSHRYFSLQYLRLGTCASGSTTAVIFSPT